MAGSDSTTGTYLPVTDRDITNIPAKDIALIPPDHIPNISISACKKISLTQWEHMTTAQLAQLTPGQRKVIPFVFPSPLMLWVRDKNQELAKKIIDASIDINNKKIKKESVKEVPPGYHHISLGGLMGEEHQTHLAICFAKIPTDDPISIWVDRDAILVNKALKLIEEKAEQLASSEEEKRVLILEFRNELYRAWQTAPDGKKVEGALQWLVKKLQADESSLREHLNAVEEQIENFPQIFATRSGISSDRIKVKDISTLFASYAEESSNEEREIISGLKEFYNMRLIGLCSGASGADICRVLAIHNEGGEYADYDKLPRIQKSLLEKVYEIWNEEGEILQDDPLIEPIKKYVGEEWKWHWPRAGEHIIQQYIFSNHKEWFTTSTDAIEITPQYNSKLSKKLDELFAAMEIKSVHDVFEPISRHEVAGEMLARGLGNNQILFAHPKSAQAKLLLHQMYLHFDFLKAFEEVFDKNIGRLMPASSSLEDQLAARWQFMEDCFSKHHITRIGGKGGASVYIPTEAVAVSPMDGVMLGAGSTIELTGPTIYTIVEWYIMNSANINSARNNIHPHLARSSTPYLKHSRLDASEHTWSKGYTGKTNEDFNFAVKKHICIFKMKLNHADLQKDATSLSGKIFKAKLYLQGEQLSLIEDMEKQLHEISHSLEQSVKKTKNSNLESLWDFFEEPHLKRHEALVMAMNTELLNIKKGCEDIFSTLDNSVQSQLDTVSTNSECDLAKIREQFDLLSQAMAGDVSKETKYFQEQQEPLLREIITVEAVIKDYQARMGNSSSNASQEISVQGEKLQGIKKELNQLPQNAFASRPWDYKTDSIDKNRDKRRRWHLKQCNDI